MWLKLARRGRGFDSEGEVVLTGVLLAWSSWRGSGGFWFELVGDVCEAGFVGDEEGIAASFCRFHQLGSFGHGVWMMGMCFSGVSNWLRGRFFLQWLFFFLFFLFLHPVVGFCKAR